MKKIIIFVIVLLSFGGCRKDAPVVESPDDVSLTIYSENYWSELFDTYWNATNQSYVFWAEDPLDWDAIYDEYAPKFADLDAMCTYDPTEYFELTHSQRNWDGELMIKGDTIGATYFKTIANQLIDHHYMLKLNDVKLYMLGGSMEVFSRDYYHEYDKSTFISGLNQTISADGQSGVITDFKSGTYYNSENPTDTPMTIASYCIGGDIAYLYLSSFAISMSDDDPILKFDDSLSDVMDNYESIIRETSNLKGLILDLRGNQGGYNADLDQIFGCFMGSDETLQFGYHRHKSGPNRLDYTEHAPCYITGTSDMESVRFPIAVLVDVNSVSMAEISCVVARAFSDQCVIIGERTYGATCSLTDHQIAAGGIIDSENLYIYSSSVLFYDLDMNFYEGVGITPDIEIFSDPLWGYTTVDEQKQTAIDYLRSL